MNILNTIVLDWNGMQHVTLFEQSDLYMTRCIYNMYKSVIQFIGCM